MNLRIAVCVLLTLLTCRAIAQTFNGSTNTDWNTASNWNPASVPSGTATDVTISSNANVAGGSFVIGDVSVGNNTTLTIASGGTLTIGSSTLYNPPGATTKTNLSYANSGTLTVTGTLYIYGDLVVTNSLTLNITGTMIVYGDVTMGNNGGVFTVSGSGNLDIRGNLSGGNNSTLATNGGNIAVGGGINFGGGNSSISANPAGSITASSCTCTGCSGGTTCSNVLPVELIYFDINAGETSVRLSCATSLEENFRQFVVEHSGDGHQFNDIGAVASKNNNGLELRTEYTYEDKFPVIGYNYYRLKAVDLDNSFETFSVKSVRFEAEKTLTGYPNPSDGTFIAFSLNFHPSERDQIRLINTFGTVIHSSPLSGSRSRIEPASQLSPGVYFLQYLGEFHKQTVRIVVTK